jgi:hypothetical protein
MPEHDDADEFDTCAECGATVPDGEIDEATELCTSCLEDLFSGTGY